MGDRVYLGIDVGGTNVLCAVVNTKGQILSRSKGRTAGAGTKEALLGTIVTSAHEALASAQVAREDLAGLGIGAPGPVDTQQGIVLEMPNIPVGRLHFGAELQSAFSVPCLVENDVNAGTYGEFWRGAGRGARDMVGIFVGTGTGGGIIIDGKIHRGKTGITGEVGHIVLDPNGPECGCGRRGCLEAVASRTGMEKAVRAALDRGVQSIIPELAGSPGARLRSGVFKRAYHQGDELAREVVRTCATYLGYGAVTLIHLISPERIVFGGGVMEALAEEMLPVIREVVDSRCLSGCAEGVALLPARLADDAGVLGVAALAMEAIEDACPA